MISTLRRTLLILLFVFLSSTYAEKPKWPVKSAIDLSSGFGDWRQNRFHAGIDIRTGGKVGEKLFAPVDGYIWRIKMSYRGYGKGLYLRGDDGYIYVFGHLNGFVPGIDSIVKNAQVAAQRYYQDLVFQPDSIRVSQGQLLGYTGQTGTGAPHLHFEKRTADNRPIQPLNHGFKLKDKVKPSFTRIGFELVGGTGLLPDGTRKTFYPIKSSRNGRFKLDTVLYFNQPFGVLADGYDQMRSGGMRQAIYDLKLIIDDVPYYEVIFDTLDFETGRMVNFEYDYEQAAYQRKRVRRLYKKEGDIFEGSRSLTGTEGIIGWDNNFEVGLHRGKVVGIDCFGNKSELLFDFIWGPREGFFKLDSVLTGEGAERKFYFTAAASLDSLAVDSIVVLDAKGTGWERYRGYKIEKFQNHQLVVVTNDVNLSVTPLKLVMKTDDAALVEDLIFNGISPRSTKKVTLDYDISEEGLLVDCVTIGPVMSDIFLELYDKDSLLGKVWPSSYQSMNTLLFFIPPNVDYPAIDRIDAVLKVDDTLQYTKASLPVSIVLAQPGRSLNYTIDSLFEISVAPDVFYTPFFLGLKKASSYDRERLHLNSDFYQLWPEVMLTRKNFKISLALNTTNLNSKFSGLCWLDIVDNRWVWLDESVFNDDNMLTAESFGGGTFAAVMDLAPPQISRLNIEHGSVITDRQPDITFYVEDSLSGFADDRNIDIRLNDEWLIPELDLETGLCKTKPLAALKPDRYHLSITVTDRAGNKAIKDADFRIIIKR